MSRESIDKAIEQSQRCIKEAEQQIEKINKLREKTGIGDQACTKVVNGMSASDKTVIKAMGKLDEMGYSPLPSDEDHADSDSDKRRNRLLRSMRNKLRI